MDIGFRKRIKLQKIIDKKRNQVSGEIVLSLYKILQSYQENKKQSLLNEKSFF